MKIRLLEHVSSSVHGSHKAGDITDWGDDAEAKQLIAAGMAEAVKATKAKVEKAPSSKKVETATSD